MKKKLGKVYLVGAGPGDPLLLTQKGVQLLAQADVIFYDNLVNPELLNLAHPESKKIYVGKRGEGKSSDQKIIEKKLVKAALTGKVVVRLKGGDPFIFGRGGEEAQRLFQENIPYEIVPGVSSAIAVPAYAGIPLTHRNFTSTIAFVTGHPSVGAVREPPLQNVDWNALAKMGTIVFLMGVKTIRQNMQNLISAGRAPQTPAAFIRWGTYPKQETIISNISNIADEIEKRKLMPPAIIVVGEVVKLRDQISWFESKPLFGKTILVTRARSQASELLQKLRDLGAHAIEVPTIEIRPPTSWKALDRALQNLKNYDWIIFTSVNAVKYFFDRFKFYELDIRTLHHCKIAAVGSATAEALESLNLWVEKLPSEFNAQKLAAEFKISEIKGQKILFPRAEQGRKDLIHLLEKKGAKVDCVSAYKTIPPPHKKEILETISKLPRIDCLTFASSSSVENFFKIIPRNLRLKIIKTPCVCMGPITQKSAQKQGFKKLFTASESRMDSLLEKILSIF